MMNKKIQIYSRYTGKIEDESVCGEWFMRFAYGLWPGRFLQNFLGCRPFFSRLGGLYANCSWSRKKILPFIERHRIDMEECLLPMSAFANFNEFFSRQLHPNARPIDRNRDAIVAPVDGRYTYIANLGKNAIFPVKGQEFSLGNFLRNRELAKKFFGGSAIIARLCPHDYHRFHFPCDGVPGNVCHICGKLHSVHPIALEKRRVFCENKRTITRIISAWREIIMVEVGATFVGSIKQTFIPHRHCKKGSEKGFFSLGGSSVVLLFEPQRIIPSRDMEKMSAIGRECFIRMGDRIATFRTTRLAEKNGALVQ
ncbi:MAG: archaetidylserine decarboxylase [Puniceicoccales bacterium]|jgi:phosphatidylserine decarboxylase|nr:archaetidylserine decarboxylase [Puniceicoccales bacterium]